MAAQARARVRDRDEDRAEAGSLEREVERLRAQLVALGAAEQAGEGHVGEQRGKLEVLNAREAELEARIDRNRDQLARLLGALQMRQRHPPPPLLVNPRSATDAVRAAILIRAITPELEARGKAFAAQAEAIRRVRRTTATASETLFRVESDVADRRAEIERLIADKRALERRLHRDADAADAEARALAARAGSMGALVQGLAARDGDNGSGAPPARLVLPIQGVLERGFGQAQPGRDRSQGLTWKASFGAPVLSPGEGRVDYAGPLKGWGLVLILTLGGGYRIVLAGLGEISVDGGRNVAAGEPVGRMAAQGTAQGVAPELYLELRNDRGALDPARWFGAGARTASLAAGPGSPKG